MEVNIYEVSLAAVSVMSLETCCCLHGCLQRAMSTSPSGLQFIPAFSLCPIRSCISKNLVLGSYPRKVEPQVKGQRLWVVWGMTLWHRWSTSNSSWPLTYAKCETSQTRDQGLTKPMGPHRMQLKQTNKQNTTSLGNISWKMCEVQGGRDCHSFSPISLGLQTMRCAFEGHGNCRSCIFLRFSSSQTWISS